MRRGFHQFICICFSGCVCEASPAVTHLHFTHDKPCASFGYQSQLQSRRSPRLTSQVRGVHRQQHGQVASVRRPILPAIVAVHQRLGVVHPHQSRTISSCALTWPVKTACFHRNRCGPNDKACPPEHTAVEALLGLHAANALHCWAIHSLPRQPTRPCWQPGVFINVTDMTSGKPTRVPKKLLDRDLSTGEFHSAQQMLQASIEPFA